MHLPRSATKRKNQILAGWKNAGQYWHLAARSASERNRGAQMKSMLKKSFL